MGSIESKMDSTSEMGSSSVGAANITSLPLTAEAVILGVIEKLESWLPANMEMIMLALYIIKSLGSGEAGYNPPEEVFDELRMLLDFLRDKKLGEGRRVYYLSADVVEMAEDIMDLSGSEDTFLGSILLKLKLAEEWLREMRMRMINLGVDEWESLNILEDVGEGDGDGDVVGLNEDVRMLLRVGNLNEERLMTLLVKGLAGVGKTTLAKKVYNHPEIVDQFKRRAWVSLSTDLTNKEVYMTLIQQVVGREELQRDSLLEKMEVADNRSLQQMLRQYLQGMPYFIVVDNVGKRSCHLDSLLKCLPQEGKGRLLVTCRSKLNIEQTFDYIHEMKALDPDNSWKLFVKTINKFTSDEEQYKFPKHLEKKGKEMMIKACGGLPVAIIDVGRQKAKQRLEKRIEWEELLEIDADDLCASLELLESCYRELDEQLQACFLFLAFFKENTTIRVQKLEEILAARLGIYISHLSSSLDGLASASFVEVVDKGVDDKLKRCRVNALLHRLSIKIAEEEMGFEIVRNFIGHIDPSISQTSHRHRVIHSSRHNEFNHYYSTVNQDKHLLSLVFHGGGGYLDDAYWKNLEQLDVLDFEDFGLKNLSETIGTTLVRLKYLGLRNNYIQEIPRSLGCLKSLKVFDIAQNFMVEVPDIIWKMNSLRRIYMSDAIFQKPLRIDMLEGLSTLTYISIDDWAYEVSSLRKISMETLGIEGVDGNSDVSKLFASLATMPNLPHLILRGFRFRSMCCLDELSILHRVYTLKLDGLLVRLPSANNFPPSLISLKLVNTCLDEDPMPVLEKLPRLVHLNLRNAYTGRQMVIHEDGFPNLEKLCMEELWNLRNIQLGQDAMARLKKLEINTCPCLESLPEEIGLMTELEELKMVTTKKIATKIRKSGLTSKVMFVDISP